MSAFQILRCSKPYFQLFSTPFAEEFLMELAKLQSDTILNQKHAGVGIANFTVFFYKKSMQSYSATARIIAMFESTNVCEQFFPSIRADKSFLRSRVIDEHLQATLRLISTGKFKLNIEKFANAKRCQLIRKLTVIFISLILVSTHFRFLSF